MANFGSDYSYFKSEYTRLDRIWNICKDNDYRTEENYRRYSTPMGWPIYEVEVTNMNTDEETKLIFEFSSEEGILVNDVPLKEWEKENE